MANYPRQRRAKSHKIVRPADGSTVINTGGSWHDLATYVPTFSDITLAEVKAGHTLLVGIGARWGTENYQTRLNVATIVGGDRTNYVGSAVYGIPQFSPEVGTARFAAAGLVPYTVAAGDLVDGAVTLRPLVYAFNTKTLDHRTGSFFYVENIGPPQT